jgi:hypothetical protein
MVPKNDGGESMTSPLTTPTPRQRFLSYVRQEHDARPVVSPFLPAAEVVTCTLDALGYSTEGDPVANEIRLSQALEYEPMFMTDCSDLMFPWRVDELGSDEEYEVSVIPTPKGDFVRRVSRRVGLWGDDSGFPVQTEADHEKLALICERVGDREADIRAYFRTWRTRVGENGVIVIGHPHPPWLGLQISQQNILFHWLDMREAFRRSMDAFFEAALFIMQIAMEEGIDFMSTCAYGTEMTSPELFVEMDLPYIRAYADWTHIRDGLFWYHSCGTTRTLILEGIFDRLGADVLETIAPPPAGDNDLRESRRVLDRSICSKGNLGLGLLRDGTPDEVTVATRRMVEAVSGYAHIYSTEDAVLPGTPPENLMAFVRVAREAVSVG